MSFYPSLHHGDLIFVLLYTSIIYIVLGSHAHAEITVH